MQNLIPNRNNLSSCMIIARDLFLNIKHPQVFYYTWKPIEGNIYRKQLSPALFRVDRLYSTYLFKGVINPKIINSNRAFSTTSAYNMVNNGINFYSNDQLNVFLPSLHTNNAYLQDTPKNTFTIDSF